MVESMYVLTTTYLDCLCCTIKNTLITMEITSPIIAITKNVTKAMITPLQSLQSSAELASIGTI